MKLRQLNFLVAKIKAIYSGSDTRKTPSDITNGLELILFLLVGALVNIIYELRKTPPTLPTIILLRMDNYTGPTLSMLDSSQVSQGLTLSQTVLDIGNKEFAIGLTFEAISRVCALFDLLFNNTFPYSRLQKLGESSSPMKRRRFASLRTT
ncbi:12190_t:CDS:2 [Cetraspora pellucida]|uniref:12190_t:CDS:1 n=1 Tax=Cetraspora pellucida TaxID=1433469 RepID=A0A9N9DDA2_9GLOM|nr:12190_t:CDS:2 [Cetraspora pellucida]